MEKSHTMRPIDVPVALHLFLFLDRSYEALAHDLQISVSTAHESVRRLVYARLARQKADGKRVVNGSALLEFLTHGVRFAFPAHRQPPRRGVPTAHAAPAVRAELDGETDPVVWPSSRGQVVGSAIEPLIPSAPDLAERCPAIYDLLTLVDVLRIGTARERDVAERVLTAHIGATVGVDVAAMATEDDVEDLVMERLRSIGSAAR